jgi:plasmid stabilization system protein ParE
MTYSQTEWTNRAYDDLLAIEEFISNKKKSGELISELFNKTEILDKLPKIGQIQLIFLYKEYRYLLRKSYKIIYTVRKQRAYI